MSQAATSPGARPAPRSWPGPVDHEGLARHLDDLLAANAVRTVFQPIVDLATGAPVAYEALARGPQGSPLERPDLLFATARRSRRLADLDRACRTAALEGARAAGLVAPWTLFVNTEPEAAGTDGWEAPSRQAASARGPLAVVVEFTERALTDRPAQLLQLVERLRGLGWGVALDDVGADRASLALLPLLRPDVVKLDLRLVQQRPTAAVAEIVNAVNAEAERTGAVVLAEGIETEEHLRTARSLGATLGQGWLFGHPAELPDRLPPAPPRPVRILRRPPAPAAASAFELAARNHTPRSADKKLLIEVSKHLERQARDCGESAVVLATFQHADFFTPATRRRYAQLVRDAALVCALGEGMPAEPLPGVRGAVLDPGDPLVGEWDIAVVAPHFAATLVARDLGDEGPDLERRFEYVITHDRDLTVEVATSLLARVLPDPHTSVAPQLPGPTPPPARARTRPARRPLPEVVLSHHLLMRALDATATGITIADMSQPEQPLIFANRAFTAMTGYELDDVVGHNCRLLQGPGTDPRAVAELRSAIEEGRETSVRLLNHRKDGTRWWNECLLSPVQDDAGRITHYIGVQNDVTARVEAEARVSYLAYHDGLTGLPNRAMLEEDLERSLERNGRHGTTTGVLFIDLDRFKPVNDEHGHAFGDQLLRLVAARLRAVTRDADLLARVGGDEFVLVLHDLVPETAGEVAARVAADVIGAMAEPFAVGGHAIPVGATIGSRTGTVSSAAELLRDADAALYTAKATARGSHHGYESPRRRP